VESVEVGGEGVDQGRLDGVGDDGVALVGDLGGVTVGDGSVHGHGP
jgi:hypothetical protein